MSGQLDSTRGFWKLTPLSIVNASLEWTGPSTWSPLFQMIVGHESVSRDSGPYAYEAHRASDPVNAGSMTSTSLKYAYSRKLRERSVALRLRVTWGAPGPGLLQPVALIRMTPLRAMESAVESTSYRKPEVVSPGDTGRPVDPRAGFAGSLLPFAQ